MDLKAAFDKVDRKELWKAMEEKKIRTGLVKRIREIYASTKNAVRVRGKVSGCFWTEKGVRQGCPLSPSLFSILIADAEEELKKGRIGGVQIGKERVWSLAYADDLVLLAKNEEGMKEMMKRMERYLKRKKLQLNTEKSKIVEFRKGGGRRKETVWKWEGKKIEEVKEIKYLGYMLQRNGRNEGQIRELKRKANIVMRIVWGIGERKFRDDFKRRMWLFRRLVVGVLLYGVEVWGWKEREELERIQKKYIKWTLNLDSCTPDGIVYKETGTAKISSIAGCRAMNFEERAIREGERKIVIECIKEREKERDKKVGYGDRELFLRQNGYSSEGIRLQRERGVDVVAIVREREIERMGQWMDGKTENSRYNKRYKDILVAGIPKYLRERGAKGSQKTIARWRCGNEEEGNKYWDAEGRKCQICRKEEGTVEHIKTHVKGIGRMEVREILSEEGKKEAVKWMREVGRIRKESKGAGDSNESEERMSV